MATVVRQTGLANMQAPLPVPRQFGLFAAARLIEDEEGRWTRGIWSAGDVSGPAFTFDPCSAGTDRQKADPGVIPVGMSGAFVVYMVGGCTAQGIGPDSSFFTDRLRLVFEAHEETAVERVLVSGDGLGAAGPYLGDDNMSVLGSGAESPLRALELLEDELARVGGGGIIHASRQVALAWDSQSVTENVRNMKRTTLGTPIAVGDGYRDAQPDGEAAAGADEEWAFVSGPIEVIRTPNVIPVPTTYAESLDRAMNDVLHIAERPYVLNWIPRQNTSDTTTVQAGVLVDLTE